VSIFVGVRHFDHERDPMIACPCGCGYRDPQPHFLYRLDQARERAEVGFRINSMCRCATYNRSPAVGGIESSAHVRGLAADIATPSNLIRGQVEEGLVLAGLKQRTIYPTHIHVELDPAHSVGVGLGD
tara:strand:+ start:1218 stop:1601 length:384 start_codon:yes stop_codon:yes gene_type:complete